MTSIEKLIEELEGSFSIIARAVGVKKYNEIVRNAIQMHKKEIIDAWNDGEYDYFYSKENGKDFADGNEYYQEKYGDNQLQLSNRGNILVDQKIESNVDLENKNTTSDFDKPFIDFAKQYVEQLKNKKD